MTDVNLVGSDQTTYDFGEGQNYFILNRWQASKTGTLSSIRLYSAGSGNVKVAIYSDNAGSPNALIGSATSSVSSGVNTIAISGSPTITSGAYYWLGFASDANTVGGFTLSGASMKYKSAYYPTFTIPDPAGTGFSSQSNWAHCMAAMGAEAAAGIAIPVIMNQYRQRR